ncbi:uncharacterized protein LOC117772643 [Hippoglossus hippoglossus]|uniref:uncharacterized protein LOC117772643 n=1 Tax=Hippoglossus hippoglossus TaxID=8267 RepID=UPI00148DF4C0|nr:uncharacterized protein LOC117772643 [Hippoglossus hippoglossus]
MLTSWLTVTALLAASASPAATDRGPLTVAATCRVKGQPELELTLNCGHGGNTGVVQYWHTPFGDLRAPGLHSELDPVFMHQDGSLVVPNSSSLHSGLYYCLLQHTEGTTLWPYELHVGAHHQENQEQENQEQDSSCRTLRIRRNTASEKEEKPAGVSNGEFAGAVAASVLLTLVLGFSAGALSRAHVLRCLGAISAKVRSLRPPDVPHRDSEVSMTTLPSMYDNEAFGIGQVWDGVTMETTISSTASSPPVKPQRSFRLKREEQQEIPAYLEGCDNTKEEKRGIEEQEEEEEEDKAGRSLEEKKEGEKEEEREVTVLYLIGDNGGSQSETDEDKYSDNGEERDGGSREEEEKDAGEKENSRREDEGRRGSEQEVKGNREKERDETEGAEGQMDKDISQQTEDEEMDRKTSEDTQGGIMGGGGGGGGGGRGGGGGEASSSPPCSARRSRIIRLYQYDEDGHRYCHLPDPAPDEPVPAPRLKQRSLSLTRLNAIMAAASAGPLDRGATRGEDQEERLHFHMEI